MRYRWNPRALTIRKMEQKDLKEIPKHKQYSPWNEKFEDASEQDC